VNAKNKECLVPLIIYCATGTAELDVLRVLLENGADVNARETAARWR